MIDRKTLTGFFLGAGVSLIGAYLLSGGFAQAQTGFNQPHMQAALGALNTARSELQAGATNKGGHRVAALNHVNAAIVEVEAGIATAF
jgi:hypothetical protein